MRTHLSTVTGNYLDLALKLDRQRMHWNSVVQDPKAFIPWEHKGVSDIEARDINRLFGDFAGQYMSEELMTCNARKDASDIPTILAVGWGRGYDSNWLGQSMYLNFQTCIVDISDVACAWAETYIDEQWEIENSRDSVLSRSRKPKVMQADIASALNESETCLGIELNSVNIWYMSRVLGCLSSRCLATFVLRKIGESLCGKPDQETSNRFVLISALRDDNPNKVSRTSRLYSRRMIFRNLSAGAGRRVVSEREAVYQYFDQVYTAMTLVVK